MMPTGETFCSFPWSSHQEWTSSLRFHWTYVDAFLIFLLYTTLDHIIASLKINNLLLILIYTAFLLCPNLCWIRQSGDLLKSIVCQVQLNITICRVLQIFSCFIYHLIWLAWLQYQSFCSSLPSQNNLTCCCDKLKSLWSLKRSIEKFISFTATLLSRCVFLTPAIDINKLDYLISSDQFEQYRFLAAKSSKIIFFKVDLS